MSHPVKLHSERLGVTGHPVLLLHGWGQTLESLKPLGQLLANSAQVHLLDLPGFGLSGHPDGVWDTFTYADRLVAYLDDNKIDVVDLVGHSFGGKIAMCFAARYPERVRKLVLMGTSGIKRRRSAAQRCRMQAIRWGGKGLKAVDALLGTSFFKKQFAERFGSVDYKQAGAMRPILVKSVNEDLTESIKTIHVPTLMLWGEQDIETPPEVAKRIHALLPQSKLHLFPGKGHMVFQDAGYHLCASYINPFLKL